MDKNELRVLAQKYLSDNATPEEKQLLDQWYNKVNSDETEFVGLDNDETSDDVRQRVFDNLHQKLFEPLTAEKEIKPATSYKRMFIWSCSTAAVFMLAVFAWIQYTRVQPGPALSEVQVVNVPGNRVMHLTLPDSSKVWLNAGSVFRYPKNFKGKIRQVELVEGRAFFEIRHQTEHPFIVKTKTLNITVLGTSFDVRSYKKEGTTKVTVVTGKVGITVPGCTDKQALMLLPEQQATLTNSNQLVKAIAQETKINEWCKNNFVFEQESLANVFKALEKEYNTQIKVDNKALLNERISIKLNNQHLDTIMETLSFTKHFKYQMANDSTVVIK